MSRRDQGRLPVPNLADQRVCGRDVHWLTERGLPTRHEVIEAATAGVRDCGDRVVAAGRLQLRLGRDLRWYPYARSGQDWEPSGPPQADPALAVADL